MRPALHFRVDTQHFDSTVPLVTEVSTHMRSRLGNYYMDMQIITLHWQMAYEVDYMFRLVSSQIRVNSRLK